LSLDLNRNALLLFFRNQIHTEVAGLAGSRDVITLPRQQIRDKRLELCSIQLVKIHAAKNACPSLLLPPKQKSKIERKEYNADRDGEYNTIWVNVHSRARPDSFSNELARYAGVETLSGLTPGSPSKLWALRVR